MNLIEAFELARQSKCGIGYDEHGWQEAVNSTEFALGFRKGWFARVDDTSVALPAWPSSPIQNTESSPDRDLP